MGCYDFAMGAKFLSIATSLARTQTVHAFVRRRRCFAQGQLVFSGKFSSVSPIFECWSFLSLDGAQRKERLARRRVFSCRFSSLVGSPRTVQQSAQRIGALVRGQSTKQTRTARFAPTSRACHVRSRILLRLGSRPSPHACRRARACLFPSDHPFPSTWQGRTRHGC